MKYYMYYVKPIENDDLFFTSLRNYINDSNNYRLYAITDNKQFAKQFESQRNMEIFKRVEKKIDVFPDQYTDLKLDEFTLLTKKKGSMKHEYIDVLMTQYEYAVVNVDTKGDIAQDLMELEYSQPYELLNDDILKTLVMNLHMILYNISCSGELEELEDFIENDLRGGGKLDEIDELATFVLTFGCTLNEVKS